MTAAPASASINRAINLAIRPMSDRRPMGRARPLERAACDARDRPRRLRGLRHRQIRRALREAGIAENDVRLVIVRDLASGEDHAVVAAHVDDKWIVLDNRRLTLIEDSDMPRVRPLFVLRRRRRQAFTIADGGGTLRAGAGRKRAGHTFRPRALDLAAIWPLRIGQRLQAQCRRMRKAQHDGLAPRRRQPMLRRLGNDRSAEGVGDDQPGIGREISRTGHRR